MRQDNQHNTLSSQSAVRIILQSYFILGQGWAFGILTEEFFQGTMELNIFIAVSAAFFFAILFQSVAMWDTLRPQVR